MNTKQKIIILRWVAILSVFLSMIIFEEWIGENAEIIRTGFILMFMVFAIKGDPFESKNPINIQEIVNNYPWIKLYLVLFGFVVIIISLIGTLGEIASEGSVFGALLIPLFILYLPFIFVTQRKHFIEAGKNEKA